MKKRRAPWAAILGCWIVTMAIAGAPASRPSVDQKARVLLGDWKGRLDAEKFHYVVAGAFVIAGDGTAAQIARYRDGTILGAQRALDAMYFKAQPEEPVLILLFETEEPYKRLAKKWLGDANPPHFGYFRRDNIMVMNVGTGTGTLVHELVHALMRPDFPEVPGWFNEGLASLYEQSSVGPDSIRGLVNWRLPGLQKALKDGKLRSLQAMMEDERFYREDLVGVNYAQARYLMMYLQEKGLLVKYYAQFRDHVREDKTGVESLKTVIGPQTLEEFEKQWTKWVQGLVF